MTKPRIKFFPNKDKKSKKNGKIPIYMRIINNSKKAECRLPIEVFENELQSWNATHQRFGNDKSNINRFLTKYENAFQNLQYSFALDIHSHSASEILQKITGTKKNEPNNSVAEYIKAHYNNVILLDNEKAEGTKKNYEKALNHITRYFDYLNRKTISFSEIERSFPDKFKEYLMSEIPSKKKRPMTEISASGIIKKIKTFFHRAINDGLIERNPFDGFKLKTKSPKKEKLTSIQVRAIYKQEWGNKTLEKIAHIFMFSVYTGLSYSDAMGLKKTHLQEWSNGDVYLHIKRDKTDEDTRLFLVSYAIDIINKYKNDPEVQNEQNVLPQESNQGYNRWLKIIANYVGVSFNLTTYTSRHTFRVMLNESNITATPVIKTMMGHTLQTDIDGVYNEVSERQLLDAKYLYQTFLDNLFKTL